MPPSLAAPALTSLAAFLPATDWQRAAACRDADPEIFFANDDTHQQVALAMCGSCPVQQQCLEHAVASREPYGIWGGTNEHERKRLRRRALA